MHRVLTGRSRRFRRFKGCSGLGKTGEIPPVFTRCCRSGMAAYHYLFSRICGHPPVYRPARGPIGAPRPGPRFTLHDVKERMLAGLRPTHAKAICGSRAAHGISISLHTIRRVEQSRRRQIQPLRNKYSTCCIVLAALLVRSQSEGDGNLRSGSVAVPAFRRSGRLLPKTEMIGHGGARCGIASERPESFNANGVSGRDLLSGKCPSRWGKVGY